MRNHLKLVAATLAVAMTAVGVMPTVAAAASGGGGGGAILTVPITGTCTSSTGTTFQCFSGTFTLTKFVNQDGQLAAQGTLVGTVTNELGQVVGTVNQTATIPASASGSCQILHLTLGPLNLNLLGLMVHLNQVVLDITAQSGPGNLLGNLLCGIAGLLDQGVPTNQLVNLLNHLLALLR